MEPTPLFHRIDHHNFREFLDKFTINNNNSNNNIVNGSKVSENKFLLNETLMVLNLLKNEI